MIVLPRTRQPRRFTPISKRHPSAAGIVGVINAYDRGAMVGSAGFAPALGFGGGVMAQQGNASGYQVKDVSAPITQNCTILLVCNSLYGTATALPNIAGAIGTSTAGSQLFGMQSDTAPGTQRWVLRAVSAGALNTVESRLGTTSTTQLDNWVCVYDGTGNLGLWRNGLDDVGGRANTAVTGAVSSFDRISLGGLDRGTDAFAYTGQNQALIIAWNRALSPQEAIQLSANPWQLFEPEVIYVKAASAATFNPAWARAANQTIVGGQIAA